MYRKLWALILVLISMMIMAGCSEQVEPVSAFKTVSEDKPSEVQPKEQPLPNQEEKTSRSYTLAFVGDIMVHEGQIKAAYDPQDNTYSFAGYFDEVRNHLGTADLTVGNLETTFAGKEKKYTGYPQFNTPETLAEELAQAGFDVLTTANNHSYDRRESGVLETIRTLTQWGISYVGTFGSAEEAQRPKVLEKDGIKVTFLAYTYGTNGLVVPEAKAYLVNRIDINKIRRDIQAARAAGAELVVTCLHFGAEYKRSPGAGEEKLVREIAEAGADLIIGTHPHVLQKIERIRVTVNDKPKEVLVAYSLGNFVSGYRSRYKDNGIILTVNVNKNADETVEVVDYQYLPIWVHRYQKANRTWYRVVPVETGLQRFEAGDTGYHISNQDYVKLKQAWKDTIDLLGPDKLEKVNP